MNKFFTMFENRTEVILPGNGHGYFCSLYAGSGCCNFGSHLWNKNSGSRS